MRTSVSSLLYEKGTSQSHWFTVLRRISMLGIETSLQIWTEAGDMKLRNRFWSHLVVALETVIIHVVRKSTWNDYTWVRVQLLINFMAAAPVSQATFDGQDLGRTGFREESFPYMLSFKLVQGMVELNGPVTIDAAAPSTYSHVNIPRTSPYEPAHIQVDVLC